MGPGYQAMCDGAGIVSERMAMRRMNSLQILRHRSR